MLFLHGIFLGLLVAIPVGPMGMLCIERTLIKGRLSGFISGLGAATADALYAAVAAFGLTAISAFITAFQMPIRIIGGILLIIIGLRTLHAKVVANHKPDTAYTLLADYTSGLLLTLTNASTIISFAALFSATGVNLTPDKPMLAVLLTLGFFVGSTLWWFILSSGITQLKNRVKNFSIQLVSHIGGAFIAITGVVIIGSVLLTAFF